MCLFATVVSFDLGVSTRLWWWIRKSWDRSRFNFLGSNFHCTSFYVICANSPMTPPCSCVISGTELGSIGMIVSSWINADALMTYHCATWVLNSMLIRLLRSVLPPPLIVVQSAMHVLLSSNFSILLCCSLHRSVYYSMVLNVVSIFICNCMFDITSIVFLPSWLSLLLHVYFIIWISLIELSLPNSRVGTDIAWMLSST